MSLRLLILLATSAWVAAGAAAAHASPAQRTIFQAPRELRSDDAALRARTLEEIRALGADTLRLNLFWRDVAPAAQARSAPAFDQRDPGAYDWTRYDRVVQAARASGLRLLVTITGPVPRWATRSRRDNVTRPRPAAFERFVTAVGRRYGGSVSLWSVWNEPNHPMFLGPQHTGHGAHRRVASPAVYRGLYRAARRGLRASGNGRDRVLIGETAPRGTPNVVRPLTFLRGTLRLDRDYQRRRGAAGLDVDGWAHHPYTTPAGPYYHPPSPGDVTIGTLGRLRRALDRAARAGTIRRGVGIWITEFGIQSRPDPYAGVSLRRQAEYASISARIAHRSTRVRAFAQYLMRDDLPRAGASSSERFGGFESGLRRSGGRRKPSYGAFRLPLTATRARRRVRLWGLVRPADGPARVRVEWRGRGAWHRLATPRANRHGAWRARARFRRGRVYRVRWRGYAGPPTRVHRR